LSLRKHQDDKGYAERYGEEWVRNKYRIEAETSVTEGFKPTCAIGVEGIEE